MYEELERIKLFVEDDNLQSLFADEQIQPPIWKWTTRLPMEADLTYLQESAGPLFNPPKSECRILDLENIDIIDDIDQQDAVNDCYETRYEIYKTMAYTPDVDPFTGPYPSWLDCIDPRANSLAQVEASTFMDIMDNPRKYWCCTTIQIQSLTLHGIQV